MRCLLLICLLPVFSWAVESGVLPSEWRASGPNCAEIPDWQVHAYNEDIYILRESGCTNYEKPFLYLIFGSDRALLEDTGAGPEVKTAGFVMDLLGKWAKRKNRPLPPLLVVHSHGHGDHTAGDKQFQGLPGVEFIAAQVLDMQKAFGVTNWPDGLGTIDLGGRMLDVIPIPGHHAASVAYYDRRTGILLTGDSLYPGRLYVSDFPAFVDSTRRLVEFSQDKPTAHVLGTHIEQSSTPFVDYPRGTVYQPQEHSLDLSRGHLLELYDALLRMNGKPESVALRDITVVPQMRRANSPN
jgi:glyoxylase-like metal-dependent hydrolase (beta-lactamase superfamily II)